jgi:CRP/FNR family transcriptional regulator, cyclic AMP receptor protein
MSTHTVASHSWNPPTAALLANLPVSPVLAAKIEALRGLALFDGSAAADLSRLAEASLLRRFDRGGRLFGGAANDDYVFLVRGRVKTTIPRGIACGELALGLFEPGDLVSEGSWAGGAAAAESVAMEDSAAIFIPRRNLECFLERNSRVAFRLLEAMAMKLRRAVDLAVQNSCLPVGDRLYRRLVELAETRGRVSARGIAIEHGLYQRELAASIGASREVVNKQLAEWRDRALVESGRRMVLVMDPTGLTQAVSVGVRCETFGAMLSRRPQTRSDENARTQN